MAAESDSAAVAALELGVLRLPDFARSYFLLAHVARKQHRWVVAANYYRAYLGRCPDDAAAYYGLAKSLEPLGESVAAILALETFLRLERRRQAGSFIEEANEAIARLGRSLPAKMIDRLWSDSSGQPTASVTSGRSDPIDPFDFDPAAAAQAGATLAESNEGSDSEAAPPSAHFAHDSTYSPLADPFVEPAEATSTAVSHLNPDLIDPFADGEPATSFNFRLMDPFDR